eukprot:6317018-Amphidinium_carterae.3
MKIGIFHSQCNLINLLPTYVVVKRCLARLHRQSLAMSRGVSIRYAAFVTDVTGCDQANEAQQDAQCGIMRCFHAQSMTSSFRSLLWGLGFVTALPLGKNQAASDSIVSAIFGC